MIVSLIMGTAKSLIPRLVCRRILNYDDDHHHLLNSQTSLIRSMTRDVTTITSHFNDQCLFLLHSIVCTASASTFDIFVTSSHSTTRLPIRSNEDNTSNSDLLRKQVIQDGHCNERCKDNRTDFREEDTITNSCHPRVFKSLFFMSFMCRQPSCFVFKSIIMLFIAMSNVVVMSASASNNDPYLTANSRNRVPADIGENVVLKCDFEFPEGIPVPYVVQWQKLDNKIPIYIWYDGYPPHTSDEYEGRISLVGRSSLNLSNVRDSDHGWYECKIYFLNRSPETPDNGTRILLDVQTPPQFKIKPPDVVYVKTGESLSLPCEALGTPSPAVIWFKVCDIYLKLSFFFTADLSLWLTREYHSRWWQASFYTSFTWELSLETFKSHTTTVFKTQTLTYQTFFFEVPSREIRHLRQWFVMHLQWNVSHANAKLLFSFFKFLFSSSQVSRRCSSSRCQIEKSRTVFFLIIM